MSNLKLKTPSVLAFGGKLVVSDALMSSGNLGESEWNPILVREKSVRGTISNRLKAGMAADPMKIDAEVSKANLQTVDVASLDHSDDTLKVEFTLRILGDIEIPTACNCQNYQESLAEKVNEYKNKIGFMELASRYAQNIASGRFLWKNRVGASDVKVIVTAICNESRQSFSFNSYDFSLNDFDNNKEIKKLAQVIEKGLLGAHVLLEIEGFTLLGRGQTVYPSQELVMNIRRGEKGKHLYQIKNQAAMHSQKIGNALRTIDTWYSKDDEKVNPISVEPYGSVTSRGVAYRQPKDKMDFFKMFDAWITQDKEPSLEQKHYIIAMLIRGGVF